jgi:transposase
MDEARVAERQEKQRYWGGHLSKWKESGLSQSAYCREHQLNLHRFIYWKKRQSPENQRISMVELPISTRDVSCLFPQNPPLCILFGDRCRIEVRPGFDRASLEAVLRVLGRL